MKPCNQQIFVLSPVPLYKQHAMKSPSQLNLSSPVSYLFPSCCLGNTYSSFKIQLKCYLLCGAHLKPLKATWIILPPSSPSRVHSVFYNPFIIFISLHLHLSHWRWTPPGQKLPYLLWFPSFSFWSCHNLMWLPSEDTIAQNVNDLPKDIQLV